jgi:hypothetical protein
LASQSGAAVIYDGVGCCESISAFDPGSTDIDQSPMARRNGTSQADLNAMGHTFREAGRIGSLLVSGMIPPAPVKM